VIAKIENNGVFFLLITTMYFFGAKKSGSTFVEPLLFSIPLEKNYITLRLR
jgi:hypothetical protein